jgi:hypothetical protein
MDKVEEVVGLLQDCLEAKHFVEMVPVFWVLAHSLKGEWTFVWGKNKY